MKLLRSLFFVLMATFTLSTGYAQQCDIEQQSLIDSKRNAKSFLGTPVGDYAAITDGCYRNYQNGSIYAYKNIYAKEVHGLIKEKFDALGKTKGFLGFPETDESNTPDKVGRFNHFQGGSIYWHPCSGASEVHGAIRNLWAEKSWETGYLGYPLSDESVTPDGVGKFNRFQRGYIYWHPTVGAHIVRDKIYHLWMKSGGVGGVYGYPKAETSCNYTSCIQLFEKGNISINFTHEGIDLRDEIARRGIDIRDQRPRNTCSVMAMNFLLEYAYSQLFGDTYKQLSVEYLNHVANTATGKTDDGDFFSSIATGYNSYGIIRENLFPYDGNRQYNYNNVQDIVNNNHFDQLGKKLVGTFKFPGKFIKENDGTAGLNNSQFDKILSYLDAGTPVAIGRSHSMAIVGYEKSTKFAGGGRFIFRDSRGLNQGSNGYKFEDFYNVKKTANDAYVYEIPKLVGYLPVPH